MPQKKGPFMFVVASFSLIFKTKQISPTIALSIKP